MKQPQYGISYKCLGETLCLVLRVKNSANFVVKKE